MSDDIDRLRRYTRWYPRVWRSANEDALLSDLLESMESAGRSGPSPTERLALVFGGLRRRMTRRPRMRRPVPMLAATAAVVLLALSPLTVVQPATAEQQSPACDVSGLPNFAFEDAPHVTAGPGSADWDAQNNALLAFYRTAPWAEEAAKCGYAVSDVLVEAQVGGDGIRRATVSLSIGPLFSASEEWRSTSVNARD